MLSRSLTKIQLKKGYPIHQFFMYNHDTNMLREKIKETNVSSSKIWQVSNTMPLCKVLSLSACARLCK